MKASQRDDDESITLLADLQIYSIDAVFNTAYLFTDRCYVKVETIDEERASVRLSAKAPDVVLEQIAKDFHNELVDQQLRIRLRRETEEIRRIIISEAFAPLEETPSEE